jgi:hypothetical protein
VLEVVVIASLVIRDDSEICLVYGNSTLRESLHKKVIGHCRYLRFRQVVTSWFCHMIIYIARQVKDVPTRQSRDRKGKELSSFGSYDAIPWKIIYQSLQA